jgi:hypothetical protein
MLKLATFATFILLAIPTAGVFGALHDQISYTISNEYFTKFKFFQFHLLDPAMPERVRAAIVGFRASWWMGIPLGLLAGIAGFIQPNAKQMLRSLLLSLLVISGFTLIFALAGLTYGYFQTDSLNMGNYRGWFIPPNLVHPRNFICAGYMHNSAYLGGLLAIPVAWIFHFYYRRLAARAA